VIPIADRTVRVTLLAQASGYIQQIEQASKKTRELGSEAEKLAQKKQSYDILGRSALAFGAAAAAAVALSVSKFSDFDAQMSSVQAATHESAASMDLLRDAAIEAGASTVFSATDSAQAIEEMAKAGVATADILGGGLSGALDLASAGELEVGRAAEIAATALTQFKLEGSDIPHVADLLAAGAGKAQGSVEDLSQALNQGGLIASQTGLTIEETTGTLAAFASAGLVGSDAGTSFKTMLQRLTPQSKEAAKEMEALGISAYDANGEFVGMEKFAGILQNGLKDLTDEQRNASLGIMFGSDAVRAAGVIYEQGAEGVADWIDQVDDSGYAAETARIKLDNLQGDIEALGGAFDTALIGAGSGANDVLRLLTQTATTAVDAFNDMPAGAQGAALGITSVAGAASLGVGAFFTLVPKVAEFKSALETMGPTAQRASSAVGKIAKGLGGLAVIGTAVALLETWDQAVDASIQSNEELANALAVSNDAAELFSKTLVNKGGLAFPDPKPFIDDISELGTQLDQVSKYSGTWGEVMLIATTNSKREVDSFKEGWRSLGAQIAGTVASGEGITWLQSIAEEGNLTDDQLWTLIESSDELKAALTNQATEAGLTADQEGILALVLGDTALASAEAQAASEQNAAVLAELAGQAQTTQVDIEGLAATIRGFASGELDARAAAREFETALDDLADSVAANGTTLDISTEQGRANEAALDDIAQASKEVAAATLERGGTEEEARAAVQRGREELIKSLEQFGITGTAADEYADKLGLIPENIVTAIVANTDPAQAAIDSFISYNSGLRVGVAVDGIQGYSGAGGITRATGGILPGPPSSTDNMLIHAASGEYVVNARQTSANRGLLEAINSGSGSIRGYADGGLVKDRVQYVSGGAGSSPSVSAGRAPVAVNIAFTDGMQWLGQFVKAEIAYSDGSKEMQTRGGVIV